MRYDLYCKNENYNTCLCKNKCSMYRTDSCNENCATFVQTDYMFQLSGLPHCWWRNIEFDFDSVNSNHFSTLEKICNNVELFVRNGFNLFLWGETGVGKTSLAIKLMLNYFIAIADRTDYITRGLFINVPSFLRDYRLNMTNQTSNWRELLESIKTCDIVIFDDLFQTVETKFESQIVYSYINDRIFADKSCIFTSNLDPERIESIDERLYSRICEGSDCVNISGSDARRTRKFSDFM